MHSAGSEIAVVGDGSKCSCICAVFSIIPVKCLGFSSNPWGRGRFEPAGRAWRADGAVGGAFQHASHAQATAAALAGRCGVPHGRRAAHAAYGPPAVARARDLAVCAMARPYRKASATTGVRMPIRAGVIISDLPRVSTPRPLALRARVSSGPCRRGS